MKFVSYKSIITNSNELRKEIGGLSQPLTKAELDYAVTILNEYSWRLISKVLPPDNAVVNVCIVHSDEKGYDVGIAKHNGFGVFADMSEKIILGVIQWAPILPAECRNG